MLYGNVCLFAYILGSVFLLRNYFDYFLSSLIVSYSLSFVKIILLLRRNRLGIGAWPTYKGSRYSLRVEGSSISIDVKGTGERGGEE